ncbi:MAG: hypothetical protein HFG79_01405 [Lachnospiraceae bacterium]|nr:hypothetical protein [Lachnospiraceae bacterium]
MEIIRLMGVSVRLKINEYRVVVSPFGCKLLLRTNGSGERYPHHRTSLTLQGKMI